MNGTDKLGLTLTHNHAHLHFKAPYFLALLCFYQYVDISLGQCIKTFFGWAEDNIDKCIVENNNL